MFDGRASVPQWVAERMTATDATRPMNVIDYGQYNSQPWPAVPLHLGTYRFTPHEPRLSDEDVERIAKRVAELLREPHDPR